MNIAEHILADAETFARTCFGLGYDTSNIERGLVSEFELTGTQAAEIITKVLSGNHNERSQHGS